MIMKKLFRFINRLFIPNLCPICRLAELQGKEQKVCDSCFNELPFYSDDPCKKCGGQIDSILDCCSECLGSNFCWDRGLSIWKYDGLIREAIHQYKYRSELGIVEFFAEQMAGKIQNESDLQIDLVTWIPLHLTKKLWRGYNQSELLAKRLSALLNLPCKKLINRVKCTRRQAMLDRSDRLKNMKSAFAINQKNSPLVKGRNVLLLDDVFTTGTTLNKAAEVLLNCSAKSVTVISIARG